MKWILLAFWMSANSAMAVTSVSQKVGSYQDNRGADKQRVDLGVGMSIDGSGVLDTTDVNLSYGYDESFDAATAAEKEKIATQDVRVSVSQTWSKLTSTRYSVGQSKVEGKPSDSYGLGASHWLFKEQLQVSVDAFKNNSIRDVIEVLDQDSEVISPPKYYTSKGAVLGLRHLANPKTVFNYGYSYITSNDRPDLWSLSAGVKRFIENPWDSKYHAAVHLDLVRIDNSGEISNTTSVGELQGMIYQVAWLQNLSVAGRMKLAYRQYRENEVTRVNKDEYFLGTDLLTAQYVKEFNEKTFANIAVPIAVEATYHRYLTNVINDEGDKIAANIYEFGASTKF